MRWLGVGVLVVSVSGVALMPALVGADGTVSVPGASHAAMAPELGGLTLILAALVGLLAVALVRLATRAGVS